MSKETNQIIDEIICLNGESRSNHEENAKNNADYNVLYELDDEIRSTGRTYIKLQIVSSGDSEKLLTLLKYNSSNKPVKGIVIRISEIKHMIAALEHISRKC